MGEKSYDVGHKYIRFSEESDFSCLCTFPHNDNGELGIERIKALALFGAVVRLIFDGYYSEHGEYIYIPSDVPEWVLKGVRSLTPHALDGGESAPFQAESTPEVLSTSQTLPKPTRRK